MADAFRGLTLRIGADARPLNSAINSIQRSVGQAQKQLNAMNKALKFDGNNVDALARAVDLAGDKAELAAQSVGKIRKAMSQVPEKVRQLANETKNAYSQTQRLKSEYNSVNASLERIHDTMISRIKANSKGTFTDEEAIEYFKILQETMEKTGSKSDEVRRKAEAAKQEFQELFAQASKETGVNKMFGQQKGDVEALTRTYEKLKASHKRLNAELKDTESAEGYRAMQTQLVAWESEIRKAVAEATEFKARIASMGDGGNLVKLKGQLERIESGLEGARAAADKADTAFERMPKSIEAARMKAVAFMSKTDSLKDKLKNVDEQLDKIRKNPAFDPKTAAMGNVYAALAKAKNKVDDLDVKLKKASGDLDNFRSDWNRLNEAVSKNKATEEQIHDWTVLADKIRVCEAEVSEYSDKLTAATRRLNTAQVNADARDLQVERISIVGELEDNSAHKQRMKAWQQRFGEIRTMGYGLYSTLTPVIAMIGRSAAQSAEEVDAAYRDMRKTVNGTEEDFERLKDAAVDYSLTHVTSAQQMLEIEAIGGQLGVQVENLEGFARTVSNLDIATNMDTEQIAENLGQLAYIMDDMDQSQEKLDSFADALVRLGNNSATQEDKIMNVMMRIASMGTISNMTTHDLLALSTAVAASGQGPEAAGTAISKTFSNIEAAVSGPEKAIQKYGETLAENGEDMADYEEELADASGDLEAFAKIAGMSADEFAAGWRGSGKEVMDTFEAFVKGLHNLKADENGSIDAALVDLGIRSVRQKQTLMNLTQTVGQLDEFRKMSETAWNGEQYTTAEGKIEEAGDAMREAEKKSEGFSGSMQKMRNAATALGLSFGDGLAPIIQALAGAFSGMASVMNTLPAPVKTVVALLGGLLAAAGPVTVAVGAIGDGILKFREIGGKMRGEKTVANLMREYGDAADAAAISAGNVAERSEKGVSRATRFAGALKSIGKGIAVGGAVAAVGFIVNAIGEAIEKANKYREATEGLRDAVQEMGTLSLDAYAAKYGQSVDELLDKQAEFTGKLRSTFSGINVDEAAARGYVEQINEIKGSWDGSEESYLRLQAAVEGYNSVTGSSLEITDKSTGALSESTAELNRNAEAWAANAKAQAAQELLQENFKRQLEYEMKLTELKEKRNQAEEYYNSIVNDSTASEYDITAAREALADYDRQIEEVTGLYDAAKGTTQALIDMRVENELTAKMMAQTAQDFRDAMVAAGGSADAFDAMAERMNLGPDELAAKLDTAKVSVQAFATLSREEIERMCAEGGGNVDEVIAKIAELAQARAIPQVDVDTSSAMAKLEGVQAKIAQIPRVVGIRLNSFVSGAFGLNATGGLSRSAIRAIPRNADGGINGIVTAATLTNVGWVGEAGDEAVFHMRHAGGAIVPLSDRQRVRPFAQAVASEMPSVFDTSSIVSEIRKLQGAGNGDVVVNVTVQAVGGNYEEIGRKVGQASAYELRMQGVCA